MLGVMRGAVNGGAGFGRVRRHVHLDVDNAALSPDVQIITPLDFFLSKHRSCKYLIPFSNLHVSCSKDSYARAREYYLEKGLRETA